MIPRCLVLLENSCSNHTFHIYKLTLDWFLAWCHKDYDSLLMTPKKELEELLQDYCIFLRTRVKNNEISPNSISSCFNGIFRFLKVNRYSIDKEAVTQLYPDLEKRGGNDAITTEQLRILLDHVIQKRDKAILHFFSATGARPEALCLLRMKHISPYHDEFYKVVLYSDDFKHEMTTFLHSEAVKALKEYFIERENQGERLTNESYVFRSRRNNSWKSEIAPIRVNVIENFMWRLWKRSGLKREKKGNRYNLAMTTSIRKRFDTILEMNPEVSMGAVQYLMDHTGYLSGIHYRRPTEEQIFKAYRAVSAELMLSNELRLKQTIIHQKSKKDKVISDYETRLKKTEELLKVVLQKLESQN